MRKKKEREEKMIERRKERVRKKGNGETMKRKM